MGNKTEHLLPVHGGKYPERFEETRRGMGGHFRNSLKLALNQTTPPIDLRFASATSPPGVSKETQEWGEESTTRISSTLSTPKRNLTASAPQYFLSPERKIRDVSRA